jgi:hypothetical protein
MPITQILFTQGSGGGGGGGFPAAYATFGASPAEGYSTDITVYAENWDNTTIYWTVVGKGSPAADPNTDMTGTLSGSWNPGFGTSSSIVTTISFTADETTEGTEYWGVNLGTSPGDSNISLGNEWPISDLSITAPADFTIEWWQKVESGGGSSPRPWSVGLYPTQQLALSYEGKISDYFWINNSYVNATSQDHRTQGWRHMAYVRNNGVLKGYINGTQYTPNITSTQQITGTTIPLYVGTGEASAGTFNGYITNLHIMKGYAKYTGNFTAPTEPTVPTVSSVFLLPVRDNENSGVDATGVHGILATVGTTTWNSDTPFTAPTPAGPYTRYNNSWGGVGGQYAGTIDFGSGNDDLLNIKRGWIVTDGTNTGYVINDAYEPFPGANAVRIDITFTPTGPATYTFTQYEIGGSLYFDGSNYLNYGASADWAPDA